ncbi:alkaline phosphatase family protein [Dyadobacter sp. CY326]|uniref:alkaline phosphatase family protein n=1 Tax=Dyadobacter sp. CY326 TaxID=2907300 RepID=UPI001F2DA7C4|nr:alkaline phosphatase family protein [Dyadobacter sp. CY326]MCE7064608.1 alkaline phosphatase family protein [Dyadobacter sp. CY326]
MKNKSKIFACFLLIASFSPMVFGQTASPATSNKNKTLLVFFDGLRPDYITEQQMPNLFAFRKKASTGERHHSVFPTVTRVNAASYSTGSYPGTHGILGNAVYFPEVDKNKSINTSHGDLSKVMSAISGPLLTAVTLGEVLESAGEKMMVFSSGTTGQAFLQNYKISGGAIINPGLILPDSFKTQVLADIGPVATEGSEDENRHKWITDGLVKYSLSKEAPLVSAIWFSDPDGAAHEKGIGSDEAVNAIKFVDAQFGRILDTLNARGLAEQYNIIISTDHGFVTHSGKQDLTEFLIKAGFKKDKESDDVVVADGLIYVKDRNEETIEKIVVALHKEEWVGAVFTKAYKPGSTKGWLEGTFSFDAIHFNHPKRTGDILVSPQWNNEKNTNGFAGADFALGVAGHGGSSPHEITIALTAFGPDIKKLATTNLPTSNVDIAPTILAIYGLPIPKEMDGRVISELLKKPGQSPGKVVEETLVSEVKYPWGTYKLTLYFTTLGKYRYFNFSRAERR